MLVTKNLELCWENDDVVVYGGWYGPKQIQVYYYTDKSPPVCTIFDENGKPEMEFFIPV